MLLRVGRQLTPDVPRGQAPAHWASARTKHQLGISSPSLASWPRRPPLAGLPRSLPATSPRVQPCEHRRQGSVEPKCPQRGCWAGSLWKGVAPSPGKAVSRGQCPRGCRVGLPVGGVGGGRGHPSSGPEPAAPREPLGCPTRPHTHLHAAPAPSDSPSGSGTSSPSFSSEPIWKAWGRSRGPSFVCALHWVSGCGRRPSPRSTSSSWKEPHR